LVVRIAQQLGLCSSGLSRAKRQRPELGAPSRRRASALPLARSEAEEPIPRPGRNTDRLQAGMRCEGCTGDRCEDALDRCLELDNRCEGCRLTSRSIRILVEETDESEDEASNAGGCFGRLRCGGRFEDLAAKFIECHNQEPLWFRGLRMPQPGAFNLDQEPPLSEGSDLTSRDPSDSGGLSGRAASGWSCEVCRQHGLAQADVCDRCGACKSSCCLVLVTPCVDCSRCPGAVDGISMVCREGCERCTDCCCRCEGCSGCFGSSNLCPQCDRCADCCKGCPNPVDHLEDAEEPLAETLERRKSREEASFDSVFLRLQVNDPKLVSLTVSAEDSKGLREFPQIASKRPHGKPVVVHNAVGDTGLRCVLATLAVAKRSALTRLHISQLSDAIASSLAATLCSVSAPLRNLELGCELVSSGGMAKLGAAIHVNSRLKTVRAWGMSVASTQSLARNLTFSEDLILSVASWKHSFEPGSPSEQVEHFLRMVRKADSQVKVLGGNLRLASLHLQASPWGSVQWALVGLAQARLMEGKVVDTNFSSLKLQVHWQWGNDHDEARAYRNLYPDPIYPGGAENDLLLADIGVSFDFDFQAAQLRAIAQSLSANKMSTLRELTLDLGLFLDLRGLFLDSQVEERRAQKTLMKAVLLNTSLTSLRLCPKATGWGYAEICPFLERVISRILAGGNIKRFSLLRAVDAYDGTMCRMQDSDAVRLATTLRLNRSLTSVELDHCMTFQGARAISDALRINTTLTSLDLSTDAFDVDDVDDEDEQWSGDEDDSQLSAHPRGHDTIEGVVECLSFNTTLRSLNLRGLPVSKNSLAALCEGIKGNTSLEFLLLEHETLDSPYVFRSVGQLPEMIESM
jgi:hypothetical protein